MDNLKQYFDEHRELLSDEQLPEGDELGFLQKLEESGLLEAAEADCPERQEEPRRRIRFHSGVQRKSRPFWRVALIPVAASLALIFMVQLALRPILSQVELPVEELTAVAVYEQYTQEISDLTRSIALLTMDMSKGEADYVMSTVESITRENVPFIDLLPAELEETRKISVLQDYASTQIGALEDYKEKVENLIAERI